MINFEEYKNSKLMYPIDFTDRAIQANICEIQEHPIHFHDCLEIIYVLKGEISVKISYDNFTVGRGDFLVVNPYDLHSIKNITETAQIAYIHFEEGVCITKREMLAWDLGVLKRQTATYNAVVENLKQIIKYVCIEQDNERSCEYARNIGMVLKENYKLTMFPALKEFNERDNNELRFQRLEGVLDFMYAHCDEKITLEKISEEFNVNKYYLSHTIKEGMGFSFKDMLNLVRVDRAERYVLDKTMPINEIIYMVGFSSVQYFSKCFEQYFQYTPAKYRERNINETILYKAFRERMCSLADSGIDEFIGMEGQDKSGLHISFKDYTYQATIMERTEDNIVSRVMDILSKERASLDFDGDELIVILHRKK